jgi:hypothetical protein
MNMFLGFMVVHVQMQCIEKGRHCDYEMSCSNGMVQSSNPKPHTDLGQVRIGVVRLGVEQLQVPTLLHLSTSGALTSAW